MIIFENVPRTKLLLASYGMRVSMIPKKSILVSLYRDDLNLKTRRKRDRFGRMKRNYDKTVRIYSKLSWKLVFRRNHNILPDPFPSVSFGGFPVRYVSMKN